MLFRKKRADKSSLKDKVAMKIVSLLLKVQVKFSKVMSSFTKNISVKNLKIWLVVFCLFGGGYSIYLIANAIFKSKGEPALKVEGINVPKYLDQDYEKYIAPGSYEALESFRKYMDSLQQVKLDSVINKQNK